MAPEDLGRSIYIGWRSCGGREASICYEPTHGRHHDSGQSIQPNDSHRYELASRSLLLALVVDHARHEKLL